MNTETLTVHSKGDGFEIIVQHDQSGSSYGVSLSKSAYEQLRLHFVRASVCGYCGRLLGKDNYPEPIMQGMNFEIPENTEMVEGSCCIAKERLGAF